MGAHCNYWRIDSCDHCIWSKPLVPARPAEALMQVVDIEAVDKNKD